MKQLDPYIPDRGDIIYVDFNPTIGREQKGLRPGFVLSPRSYSKKTSLALVMPITKHQKGYAFEVLLPDGLSTYGVILTDQIKCIDWKGRKVQFIESVSEETVEEVQEKIRALLL
ncbi:type II toxin-antitoxin system PemK/MazF family toxin [Leptolyngbya sp. AN03gr2]|uniref:type II toxin-antitoxin system PemK/MazF family toxin n=1 Tax=unclassified Leptolyngbya TaxID=2650499 RepID=UPI003D31A8FF